MSHLQNACDEICEKIFYDQRGCLHDWWHTIRSPPRRHRLRVFTLALVQLQTPVINHTHRGRSGQANPCAEQARPFTVRPCRRAGAARVLCLARGLGRYAIFVRFGGVTLRMKLSSFYVFTQSGSAPACRDNVRTFPLSKLLSCSHRPISAKSGRSGTGFLRPKTKYEIIFLFYLTCRFGRARSWSRHSIIRTGRRERAVKFDVPANS